MMKDSDYSFFRIVFFVLDNKFVLYFRQNNYRRRILIAEGFLYGYDVIEITF